MRLTATGKDANGTTQSVSLDVTVNPVAGVARFPGDPGVGNVAWGMTHEGGVPAMPQRAIDIANSIGHASPLYPYSFHRYSTEGQATIAGMQAAAADAATIHSWRGPNGNPVLPYLDFKEPSGMTFAQVGQGGMDDLWNNLFTALAALPYPTVTAYHNEPQGDTANGSLTGMGASDFGAAMKRIATLRDAIPGAKAKITVTAALGIGSCTEGGGSHGSAVPWLNAMAPWVDVWDAHRYEQASDVSGTWKDPATLYGFFWDMQDQIDSTKAKMLTEWAIRTRTAVPGYSPQWMDTLYSLFVQRGGAVAHFFDSGANLNNQQIPWFLDYNGETSRMVKFANQLLYPTSLSHT